MWHVTRQGSNWMTVTNTHPTRHTNYGVSRASITVNIISNTKAGFCPNTKMLQLLNGCCFYKTPVTWTIYFILSWIILIIDECINAYGSWIKALRVILLEEYLTQRKIPRTIFGREIPHTICGREVGFCQKVERKTYDMLDEFVELDGEYSFDPVRSNEAIRVNIKQQFSIWFDYCWSQLPKRLMFLTFENTIQCSYQTSMMIFEFVFPNLWDIGDNLYTFRAVSVLRILSISSSAFSLISPIINRQRILAFIHETESSGLSTIIKCCQILIHMIISTIIVILLGFHSS